MIHLRLHRFDSRKEIALIGQGGYWRSRCVSANNATPSQLTFRSFRLRLRCQEAAGLLAFYFVPVTGDLVPTGDSETSFPPLCLRSKKISIPAMMIIMMTSTLDRNLKG